LILKKTGDLARDVLSPKVAGLIAKKVLIILLPNFFWELSMTILFISQGIPKVGMLAKY